MLHFPSNALSSVLEDLLDHVHADEAQQLRMPIKLELGGGLGAATLAVQVVATWARLSSQTRQIRLSKWFAESAETKKRFASTLPGMAALYFADSIDCEGTIIRRQDALVPVAPHVDAMDNEDYQNTLRGIGVALCCFMGARKEYLKPLYADARPRGVHDETTFSQLVQRVLESLNNGRSLAINDGQSTYITSMVHQLFLNSDQHGAYDQLGERYKSGIRGITARFITLNDMPSLVSYAGNDSPLRSYLTRLPLLPFQGQKPRSRSEKPAAQPIRLLEISVFDTGPGLALRWMAERYGAKSYDDFSETEELAAVKTCFEKHTTTKAGKLYGQGLPEALGALRKLSAFMTLRTGRLSLYQDFSNAKTSDFSPTMRFQCRQLAEIAGAAYTIWFRVK